MDNPEVNGGALTESPVSDCLLFKMLFFRSANFKPMVLVTKPSIQGFYAVDFGSSFFFSILSYLVCMLMPMNDVIYRYKPVNINKK